MSITYYLKVSRTKDKAQIYKNLICILRLNFIINSNLNLIFQFRSVPFVTYHPFHSKNTKICLSLEYYFVLISPYFIEIRVPQKLQKLPDNQRFAKKYCNNWYICYLWYINQQISLLQLDFFKLASPVPPLLEGWG